MDTILNQIIIFINKSINKQLKTKNKMAKTTTKSTGTEVAVAGQFSEASIQPMLEQINARISAITGGKEKKSSFSGSINGEKLSDVKDVDKLITMYAFITKKAEAFALVIPAFQAKSPTTKIKAFREEGATLEDVQNAILDRFSEITFEEELSKLKETKKALEECLSEEAKKAAKLQNLGETLKNLLA